MHNLPKSSKGFCKIFVSVGFHRRGQCLIVIIPYIEPRIVPTRALSPNWPLGPLDRGFSVEEHPENEPTETLITYRVMEVICGTKIRDLKKSRGPIFGYTPATYPGPYLLGVSELNLFLNTILESQLIL